MIRLHCYLHLCGLGYPVYCTPLYSILTMLDLFPRWAHLFLTTYLTPIGATLASNYQCLAYVWSTTPRVVVFFCECLLLSLSIIEFVWGSFTPILCYALLYIYFIDTDLCYSLSISRSLLCLIDLMLAHPTFMYLCTTT